MFFLRFSLVFLAVGFLLMPKPQTQNAKKPSMSDFDFTTNSNTRTIPELFGTAKLSGNLIAAGDLKSYPIKQDGGKKSGDFIVGYRNHMTFRLAYRRRVDSVRAFYQGNSKISNLTFDKFCSDNFYDSGSQGVDGLDPIQLIDFPTIARPLTGSYIGGSPTYSIASVIRLNTGKSSSVGGSNYGKSGIRFYSGYHKVDSENINKPNVEKSNVTLTNLTGKSIGYYNCRYAVFPERFIGDNRQSLPDYKFVMSNFNLGNNLITSYQGGYHDQVDVDDITHDTDGDCHPYDIIFYIFEEYLNIKKENIDYDQNHYDELIGDKLFISFVMTSENSVKDWLNEILRHIDATIYFNKITGKYTIHLIRYDEVEASNYVKIDESKYKNLKILKKDYKYIRSKITIKYTHPRTFNETSIVWNNDSNFVTNENEEIYEFMMFRQHKYAKKALKRLMKKEGYPTSSFKFTLPASIVEQYDNNNKPLIYPGCGLKLSNNKVGYNDKVIRVLEVSGGGLEEAEYDIVRTEDVFDISNLSDIDFQENDESDIDYSLEDLDSNLIKVIDSPREMTSNDALLVIVADDTTDDEIINGFRVQDGRTGRAITLDYTARHGYLKQDFNDTTGGNIINIDDTIRVYNTTNFKEITGSDMDFQRMKYTAIFDDGEMMSLKNIFYVENGGDPYYEISGLMRGLNNTTITDKTINSEIFIVTDVTANNLKSLPIVPSVAKKVYTNKFNNIITGERVLTNHTYDYTMRKPYVPSNVNYTLENNILSINWGRTKRLAGRNYRSPEIIVAGEDEGQNEDGIQYIITSDGFDDITTSDLNIEINNVTSITYFKIKSVLSGYYSKELTFNII